MYTVACAWQIHILLSELSEIPPPPSIFSIHSGLYLLVGNPQVQRTNCKLKYLCNILPQETTSLKSKFSLFAFIFLEPSTGIHKYSINVLQK